MGQAVAAEMPADKAACHNCEHKRQDKVRQVFGGDDPVFLPLQSDVSLSRSCARNVKRDGIARRANAILLLDDGESCVQIAKFLYLDDDTIRGWYKTYREGGWDALSTDGWKGGSPA